MTKEKLSELNIGDNLDQLMNLDPRGYGVCRILYAGSRAHTGEPLTMHCAKELVKAIQPGDLVYIMTGFILRPHKVPEMDGIVSTILLCRALVEAFNCKPVIICPEDNVVAIKNCAPVIGLHLYEDLDTLCDLPMAMGVIPFTKDADEAATCADHILTMGIPKALITIEAPGANEYGEYHNAIGVNVTELEAKMDILFDKIKAKGILTMSIGDLGNEIGMGTIGEHIRKYIPYTDKNQCKCDCKGGILARTKAEHIITATTSDWGCFGLIGALAYQLKNIRVMHDASMQAEVMTVASRSGMIDMTGSLLPGVDGFNIDMNSTIVSLMRQCVEYGIGYENETWFANVIDKNFYRLTGEPAICGDVLFEEGLDGAKTIDRSGYEQSQNINSRGICVMC